MKDSKRKDIKVRQFIQSDDAVNVVLGHILNLTIMLLITGGIIEGFYLREESSSQKEIRMEFTDLGSQIARDITNIYIITSHSDKNNDINLNIRRNIPLTIGGKGYSIELIDANSTYDRTALVNIKEEGFLGYKIATKINSIGPMNISGVLHSGSGEINMNVIKNNSGVWVWLK